MNKKQLITMWVGILLVSLVWHDGHPYDQETYIPIIVVVTVGLIISFSNKTVAKLQAAEKLRKDTKDKEGV